MIKLVTIDGRPLEEGLQAKIQDVISRLKTDSGKIIQKALLFTTRNHFKTIYPGSKHYAPEKVTEKSASGTEGSIKIDVPGVTRAYHDLDIKPKLRKYLTIPIHRAAYGKKANEFNDIFPIHKKNGKSFLARKDGGELVFMYLLSKGVHQPQDKRLMPSDDTYRQNVLARIKAYLKQTAQ